MVYYLSSSRPYSMDFNRKNLMEGKIMGVPAWVLVLIPLIVMIICLFVCYSVKPAWCCSNPEEADKSKRVVSKSKALSLCFLLPLLMLAVVGGLWFNAENPL